MGPLPSKQSGIVIEAPGGVEVLKWKTDLLVPELKEGQVLVQNEYIGVNYIDTYFRTGLYPSSYPLVTGKEGAGIIAAAHSSIKHIPLGTRVAYLHPTAAAYAQLTAVPASHIVPLPPHISTQTAAAAFLQGLTALTLIREAADIKPDVSLVEQPWVLVHAAAGGTGSQLVQMLAACGAHVIGAAGTAEKCEMARKNGAQWVVNSRTEDVVGRVKEITSGKGVDVVFDGVGKETFEISMECVARKGSLVVFGNASGKVPPFDILRLGKKNIKIMRPVLFAYLETLDEFESYTKELLDMISQGKLACPVHEIYRLEDVARAHSDLEGRKTSGKLLLKS